MPRYIDIEPFENQTGITSCCVQTSTQSENTVTVRNVETSDIPTIDPESLRPHWRGEKGDTLGDPGPDYYKKTTVVPVEKLGKLGNLMIPYKGCPRGQMGRMCGATLEDEAFYMGVITDEDGGRWVPVNEDVLRELIEKAQDRPHGRWVRNGTCNHKPARFKNPDLWTVYKCSECGYSNGRRCKDKYCPNCGAKMDLEET